MQSENPPSKHEHVRVHMYCTCLHTQSILMRIKQIPGGINTGHNSRVGIARGHIPVDLTRRVYGSYLLELSDVPGTLC